MSSTNKKSLRAWLSPITGISFLVIGITGILMFFHIRLPGITVLHELGGILFVIVGALHLNVNWHPFLACCRQRTGRIALYVGIVIMVLFLILGIGHDEHHRRRGDGRPSHAEVNRH